LPTIEDIEFSIYELRENSHFDDFFAYVVKLDFKIEDEDYEEKMKKTLKKIIQVLK